MPAYESTLYASPVERASAAPTGALVRWTDGVQIPKEWLHPEWQRREPDWRLFRLCYVGGREFLESVNPVTLFSHTREDQPSYDWRRRRASYRNHAEAIVGMIADAIFQPQVLRQQTKGAAQDVAATVSPGPPPGTADRPTEGPPRIKRDQLDDASFEGFLRDVDGKGTNADPFMNDVERWASVYGTYWVGVAMTSSPELEARVLAAGRRISEQEARDAGIRPYFYGCAPSSVIDWGCDDCGRLTYAVVMSREERRAPLPRQAANQFGRPAGQPKPRVIARVLYPDREERFEVGPRGGLTPIGVYPHPFGEVPLVPVMIRADGHSLIEDISRICIEVFNLDSQVNEQGCRQTFNQLVAEVEKPEDFSDNVTGTDSLICLQAGKNERLSYLAPTVETITALRDLAEGKIAEMYAMAHLRSRPGGRGGQPAVDVSGVAYAFENKTAENALAGIAIRLEEAELKLLGMRARALGFAPSGAICQYPREFDVRALLSRATEAQQLRAAGLPKEAMGEILKALARKALPRVPAWKLAEIDTAIDALPEPEAPPASRPAPPNQGMQAPGSGAGEDRMARAVEGAGVVDPADEPDSLAGQYEAAA